MPANVSYTILECSGEDPENPCAELLAHTQASKGWSTPKNCAYPQHLTLVLERPTRLQQVQFLTHEYKIAGKIELQIAPLSHQQQHSYEFTRLGYFAFGSNEATQFSARELKSITFPDVEAIAVRIIIHRCHPNSLNVYNQASLIMVNVVGEPLLQQQPPPPPVVAAPALPLTVLSPPRHHASAGVNTSNTSNGSSGMVSAASNTAAGCSAAAVTASVAGTSTTTAAGGGSASTVEDGVDEVTAQRIAELQAQKAAAVAVEDYDEAKRLKAAVDRLRAAGSKMAALEARKKAAVEMEDYDTAKSLKLELEKMRHRAYAAALRGDAIPGGDIFASPDGKSAGGGAGGTMRRGSAAGGGAVNGSTAIEELNDVNGATATTTNTTTHRNANVNASNGGGFMRSSLAKLRDSFVPIDSPSPSAGTSEADLYPSPTPAGTGGSWTVYDERPARAKGAYDLGDVEKLNANSPPPGAVMPLRRIDENAAAGYTTSNGNGGDVAPSAMAALVPDLPPPPFFPSELPPPEPLSSAAAKESGPMVALIGEFYTRCLYGSIWQLKESAMAALARDIAAPDGSSLPGLTGDADAMRLICDIVAQGLKARIPAVSGAALGLLRSLVKSSGPRQLPGRDLQAALSELLPAIAERAADAAPRARDQAIEALVDLARIKESGLISIGSSVFLRPIKRREAPKATLGRLQLVAALVPVLGVANNEQQAPGGFSPQAIVNFVAPALTSANAEVRAAASDLVLKVGKAPGVQPTTVLPLLPADLNPKLREHLEMELTGLKPAKAQAGSSRPTSKSTTTSGSAAVAAAAATSGPSAAARPRPSASASAAGGASRRPASGAAGAGGAPHQQQRQATRQRSAKATTTPTTAGAGAGASPAQHPARRSSHAPPPHAAAAAAFAAPSHCSSNSQPHRPDDPYQLPAAATAAAAAPPHSQQYQQQYHQPPLDMDPSSFYTPSVAPTSAAPELSIAEEDPTIYEEELHRRETTLGPVHPAVAEAASHLAIIYNQRGEGLLALPLYQRALQIWEQVHGPDHPEVAHALTDIAVILLEAGHDADGKRLLHRALDIQSGLLGPNHPDVVAIRDVLEE